MQKKTKTTKKAKENRTTTTWGKTQKGRGSALCPRKLQFAAARSWEYEGNYGETPRQIQEGSNWNKRSLSLLL